MFFFRTKKRGHGEKQVPVFLRNSLTFQSIKNNNNNNNNNKFPHCNQQRVFQNHPHHKNQATSWQIALKSRGSIPSCLTSERGKKIGAFLSPGLEDSASTWQRRLVKRCSIRIFAIGSSRGPSTRRKNRKTQEDGDGWEILNNYHLSGGFKYFLFSSLPGDMIQFD